MSLFKGGMMREAKRSTLKSFLLQAISPAEPFSGTCSIIVDGGAFLWCCNRNKGELFGDIFREYVDTASYFRINVIVFDGYAISTKDSTH